MMTMYEQIGGHETLRVVVVVFYRRVLRDPLLAPLFDGFDLARLRSHQTAFLGAVLDGPDVFTGRSLQRAHAGLGISHAAFDALIAHLAASLVDAGVAAEAATRVTDAAQSFRPAIVTAT
jgi:hemoglobin